MEDKNIVLKIAEIEGGDWLYNPNAETPHRFWVGKDTYISHGDSFVVWDRIKDIPIGEEYCHFNDYLNSYEAIMPVIHEQESTKQFIVRFLESLHEQIFGSVEPYHSPEVVFKLIKATPRQLCIALLQSKNLYE